MQKNGVGLFCSDDNPISIEYKHFTPQFPRLDVKFLKLMTILSQQFCGEHFAELLEL